MLQCGLGLSWIVGGKRERRPSVDEIGHLWPAGGQRHSVQVDEILNKLRGGVGESV